MAKKKKKQNNNHKGVATEYREVNVSHGAWEPYLEYGPQYDTVNDCPIIPGETRMVELTRFSKLNKDSKEFLKEYMKAEVERFWEEHHQIPFGGEVKAMRQRALDVLLEELEVFVKDEPDVTRFLNDRIPITINRLLKKEASTPK